MIKIKGNNISKVKDMGVVNQVIKEKNMKEKCLKNNAKHENEQVQKKGLTNRSI
jgi:hypothetical protein